MLLQNGVVSIVSLLRKDSHVLGESFNTSVLARWVPHADIDLLFLHQSEFLEEVQPGLAGDREL